MANPTTMASAIPIEQAPVDNKITIEPPVVTASVSDINKSYIEKQIENNQLQTTKLNSSVIVKPENTVVSQNAPSNYQPPDLGETPVRIKNKSINASLLNQTVVV